MTKNFEPNRIGRLWAGWRSSYVSTKQERPSIDSGSVFEDIFLSDDPEVKKYILWEGNYCAAMLNTYPYVSGHTLVLPKRAVPNLLDLSKDESSEIWQAVNDSVAAITNAYNPHGVNVGMNIGRAAGASIPEHLHVHCLPRWEGDTTFLTSIAEAKMIPEPLMSSYEKLKKNWPS